MNDVTIPADEAKRTADGARAMSANLRSVGQTSRADFLDNVADLLDPRPPSLREQVAEKLRNTSVGHRWDMADDVLAVVADWLAAQPAVDWDGTERDIPLIRRDDAVALIRGEGTA